MPRLSLAQWEQARADYEVKGESLREIGRKFGVTSAAIVKKAKFEQWEQGKSKHLVDRKVNALKELKKVEDESKHLPITFQITIDDVVKEQLRAENSMAVLKSTTAGKMAEMVRKTDDPDVVEQASRAYRNMAGNNRESGTTVNVNQQTAALATGQKSPRDVLAELLRQVQEDEQATN